MKKKPTPETIQKFSKLVKTWEPKSKCCSHKVETVSSREGTCFYRCLKCEKDTDLR